VVKHPDETLRNARILVIGTGAMGQATAQRMLYAGAQVTLAGRSGDRLADIAARITGLKTQVADTEDAEQTAELMGTQAPWDHVAVLTSGTGARASSIVDTSPLSAKLAFSRFWMTYNVLHSAPGTVRPGGSICVLSGSSGRRPLAGFGVWGALHGSLESLALNAAVELSPIRVNVLSPGGIGIRMDRQLVPHPGVPDDVANMIHALMINPAVTSAVVDVDGGERLGTYPSTANAWAS